VTLIGGTHARAQADRRLINGPLTPGAQPDAKPDDISNDALSGDTFAVLAAKVRPRLLQALVARFGPETGGDACDAALAWAWEHRDRMETVTDPLAYLYRVGQSHARPGLRWLARRADPLADDRLVAREVEPVDPELIQAMRKLPPDHRSAVLLVHAYGWTIAEVAAVRDVPVTTVTNHLQRGMTRLRHLLVHDHRQEILR
jgi:DNA-directed RNA polymerase specialized sigma24 family protein